MSGSFQDNKIEISDAIGKARDKSDAAFQSWFNKSGDAEESFIRGAWDFAFYFASPAVCAVIKKPEEKRCLEIGYGGGRLLNASRNYFKYSYGVDIHPFHAEVRKELLKRAPVEDFELFRLQTEVFPLASNSIDYAYSFIVIQHFYSASILKAYLGELGRVVKPGGVANLFFADLMKYPEKGSTVFLKALTGGCLELEIPPDATTAHNTLWVTRKWMARELKAAGFKPMGYASTYKGIPEGYGKRRGQQTGILAMKV